MSHKSILIMTCSVVAAVAVYMVVQTLVSSSSRESAAYIDCATRMRGILQRIPPDHRSVEEGNTPNLADLISWLPDDISSELNTYTHGRLDQDEWGSPFVVLIQNGTLMGLGSSGPNKLWQNGDYDDLIAYYSDSWHAEIKYGAYFDKTRIEWNWGGN